jgi:hypothetical protein
MQPGILPFIKFSIPGRADISSILERALVIAANKVVILYRDMKQQVWDDCSKVRSATLEGKDNKTKYQLSVDAPLYETESVYL